MAKLSTTSETVIGIIFLVMNLEKCLQLLLFVLFGLTTEELNPNRSGSQASVYPSCYPEQTRDHAHIPLAARYALGVTVPLSSQPRLIQETLSRLTLSETSTNHNLD